jgi:hypothetical protein
MVVGSQDIEDCSRGTANSRYSLYTEAGAQATAGTPSVWQLGHSQQQEGQQEEQQEEQLEYSRRGSRSLISNQTETAAAKAKSISRVLLTTEAADCSTIQKVGACRQYRMV